MKTAFLPAFRRFLIPLHFALLLVVNMHAASDKTLFDFQTATNVAAWQVVNDDVMGGISISRFFLTNGVASFQGTVSLENNGGFASVRSMPADLNLAGCNAFLLRFLGDGRRYKFTARTTRAFDGPIYQSAITTKKGEWTEHRLLFKDFVPTFRGRVLSGEPPLDPAKITSVGFMISDNQNGSFQLDVAWIKAVSLLGPLEK